MSFAGEFEVHLTVTIDGPAEALALSAWGFQRGFKFTHIVLDRGVFPSQPMLTCHGEGEFESHLESAHRYQQHLEAEGFTVTRLKLEVPPWSPDVPQTQADLPRESCGRYFEHHVKLLLPSDDDLSKLSKLAATHGARLSRNAFRVREDGQLERFVTQRCHHEGRLVAQERLADLVQALSATHWPILEIEEEYVVFDSKLELDDGWSATPRPESTPGRRNPCQTQIGTPKPIRP
jgi:hypothetical protein